MKEYLYPKHINDSKKKMVFILLILSIMLCPIISTTCIHANDVNASVVNVLYFFIFYFNDVIICNVDVDV